MHLADITILAFTVSNSLRIFAYLPQIVSAVRDRTGCSAISWSTWGMFLIAHVSSIAYTLVNLRDNHMALVFTGNALCCVAILGVAIVKRQYHAASRHAQ